MFDGRVPEQLRRFIVSAPPPPPPPPHSPPQPTTAARALPFPVSFPPFETTNHFLNPILLNNTHKIIDHHHHPEIKVGDTSGWISPTDHDYNSHNVDHHHPWSSEEVLALIRLRSAMENWFPEFTWDHISRKLIEIGCKRTPQECKEKFEEEERKYFDNNHNNSNNNLNNYNTDNKDNYRMFSELEELYHHGHHHHHHRHHDDDDDDDHVSSEVGCIESEKQAPLEEPRGQENDKMGQDLKDEDPKEREGGDVGINPSEGGKSGNMKSHGIKSSPTTKLSSSSPLREMMTVVRNKKKRKRRERFEMLKGFCEGFVRNMVAQQEEMHKKLLEDMMKRDEEKIAREEAWKKQEMERINKELEIRAHEQALASDRNATIIKFISKFTSSSSHDETHNRYHRQQKHIQQQQQQQQLGNYKVQSPSTSQSSSSLVLPQIPSDKIPTLSIDPGPSPSAPNKRAPNLPSSQTLNPQNPSSLPTHVKSLEPISTPRPKTKTQNPKPLKNNERDGIGKRWPRDEVLALINIRCSTTNNNGDDHHEDHHDQHHKDGSPSSSSSKALPLWERIAKKMLELGYKRSAKRCKEKWENINKYFRKTKHVDKKRPLDSRTCPYFHQLSTLYSQGSLGTAVAAATVISPAAGEGASDGPTGTQPDKTLVGSLKDESADEPTMHTAEGSNDHEKKNVVQDPGFDFEFQLDN